MLTENGPSFFPPPRLLGLSPTYRPTSRFLTKGTSSLIDLVRKFVTGYPREIFLPNFVKLYATFSLTQLNIFLLL